MTVTEEKKDGRRWFRDELGRTYKAFYSNDPEIAPPDERYRYVVARNECRHNVTRNGIKIQQNVFAVGTVLGEGFCEPGFPPELMSFEPADGVTGVEAGHIVPRLRDGRVRAEPIK